MVVAKTSEDLRLAVICQSDLDIAGFLRKLSSMSLGLFCWVVEFTLVLNSEGCRREASSQAVGEKVHSQEGNNPDW